MIPANLEINLIFRVHNFAIGFIKTSTYFISAVRLCVKLLDILSGNFDMTFIFRWLHYLNFENLDVFWWSFYFKIPSLYNHDPKSSVKFPVSQKWYSEVPPWTSGWACFKGFRILSDIKTWYSSTITIINS